MQNRRSATNPRARGFTTSLGYPAPSGLIFAALKGRYITATRCSPSLRHHLQRHDSQQKSFQIYDYITPAPASLQLVGINTIL
ncbi:MAG: hypothetical protein KKF98_10920 [Bacteroidetes bacterium]|nr:hypothetical protein [Bacteroidota bacterium]